ncbi:MAG: alpha/beta hydrolase, partial [Pseudomonadota bacterium]
MGSQKIEFEGSLGGLLAARLDFPDGKIKAYALFAHCFSCGKDLNAINRISSSLNDQGIALFRFDFTGLGKSQGDFGNTNFSSNVKDLVCAARFMGKKMELP